MELKNSVTMQNLMTAFSGEAQARSKYDFFSEKAREEGFEYAANIFSKAAENERAHAQIWFDYLCGVGNTSENLISAAAGEHYEWYEMYYAFAKKALEEGFDDIAKKFEQIGNIENEHEKQFAMLIQNPEHRNVSRSDSPAEMVCENCGYTHPGVTAPKSCPVCGKPREYFVVKAENY